MLLQGLLLLTFLQAGRVICVCVQGGRGTTSTGWYDEGMQAYPRSCCHEFRGWQLLLALVQCLLCLGWFEQSLVHFAPYSNTCALIISNFVSITFWYFQARYEYVHLHLNLEQHGKQRRRFSIGIMDCRCIVSKSRLIAFSCSLYEIYQAKRDYLVPH